MKTKFNLLVLVLLVIAASPCFALMGIQIVSRERAKELGIEVRAQASGTNAVWVQLEFKPVGRLKDFSHVSLEIRDGEKLLFGWSALKDKRTESGSISVSSFIVNRAFLEKVTLTVVTGHSGLLDLTGHELRLKDFVDLEKLDKPTSAPANLPASPESPGAPATPR